jgi:hypothetical protein
MDCCDGRIALEIFNVLEERIESMVLSNPMDVGYVEEEDLPFPSSFVLTDG